MYAAWSEANHVTLLYDDCSYPTVASIYIYVHAQIVIILMQKFMQFVIKLLQGIILYMMYIHTSFQISQYNIFNMVNINPMSVKLTLVQVKSTKGRRRQKMSLTFDPNNSCERRRFARLPPHPMIFMLELKTRQKGNNWNIRNVQTMS